MSFTDDYLKALEEEKKKKKKKEKETTTAPVGKSYDLNRFSYLPSYSSKNSAAQLLKSFAYQNDEEDEEDIAPVAEERTWFKSAGLFDDGYQFGDLTKTILGTGKDIRENVYAGVIGAGEKAIDFGAGAVEGISKLLGADKFASDVESFIEKDLIDEEKVARTMDNLTGLGTGILNLLNVKEDTDDVSVLGEKTDSLAQSAGQLALTFGGQMVGIPWWVTSGVTSAGGEMENALKEGATYEEAALSSAISAGAELLTEKLFGGSGLGEKGLINLEPLTKGISSKLVKALADFGLDMASEGAEEVVSQVASNLGSALYKEENLEELLLSEEAFDGYLESFIGGVALGGGMNVGKVGSSIQSIKTGNAKDYRTGNTANEQAVIDKEVENRIAEQEKNGKKLTKKEKAAIEEAVLNDLEKGYISTDTIESVLGKDSYSAYDSLVNESEEFKTLYETESGKLSEKQKDRLAELKEKNKANPYETALKAAKDKVSQDVFALAKGDRLVESYNEQARRGQAYEADLTKYEKKQQAVIKKAVDSGILNNTRRTHEFVDMIAKISADKGVSFDFTNNEKLKTSGFAVDGKTVNGYVTKDGITLNIQSSKSLNSVVGHEITHVLEGTELYTELQNTVFEYAKTKNDFDGRLKSLESIYQNVKDADIDAELTADLVGDYLFADSDFINNLSTNHRNVFQKIYDEVKYLCKVVTAGSKEARQLEKVKRAFEKAYNENVNVKEDAETEFDSDDVQYSISVTDKDTLDSLNEQVSKGEYDAETNPNGGYYVTYKSMSFWGYDENGNAILRSPMAEYVDGELSNAYLIPKDKSKLNWYQATETMDEKTGLPTGLMVKTKKPGNKSFSYVPAAENQELIADDWSNLYFNLKKKVLKNGKWVDSDVPARYNPYEHSSNSMLNDQFSSAYLRDNLVTVKMYVPISEDGGAYRAQWSKDPTGWADWKTGTVAGKINKQKDLQRRVYLSRYAAPVEIVPDSEVAQAYKGYLEGTDVTIPDNVVSPSLLKELEKAGVPIQKSGKVKYSLSADSNGKQLSDAQKEYFKNSKVVDENGNLKVMYHGTSNGGHTVFDPWGKGRYGLFGVGIYFTDSKNIAESYTKKGKGTNPQVYESYLNIKNPMDMDAPADRDAWVKQFPDAMFPESGTNEDFYRAMEEYFEDEGYVRWEAEESAMDAIWGMGYDGITHIGGGRVNPDGERHRVYIAFDPEQVKNTDNVKPTSNPDIRYSLSQTTDTSFSPEEIHTIQSIGRKSINNFNSQDIAATEKFARRYWEEMGAKSPFYRAWFGDWRSNDKTPVQIATKQGDTRTDRVNKDTGWTIRNSRMVHNETTSHKSLMNREAVPYLPYIDEIIENAILLDTEGVGKAKSENSLLMHYLYAVADIGNGAEVLKLTVEEMYNPGTKGTNKRAYTLQNIEKAFAASGMVQGNSPSHGTNTTNAVNTVADLFALVKKMDGNFSPSDSSKIINADGTPKVMYHGSPAQFTVFDKSKAKSSGHYGKGFYFTDSTSHAGTYGNQYAVYLNIRNPLQSGGEAVSRSQVRSYLEAVAENEDYSIENYGTYDIDEILNNIMGKEKSADAFKIINDINATAIGNMVEAAELFNSVNGTAFDGIVVPTETVAFYPEQIKSATDNIGTFDKNNPDIRFSLSEAVEETDRLVAVHNKSVRGVMRMLERDGVPFASIAIKKAGTPHEGFGECSVVFPRSTIDPEANEWNKLYSNDAWTPTEPRTEYDVGDTYKYKKLFENMLGSDIYYALRGNSQLDSDALERELGSTAGNVFEAVKRLNVVKYGYLQSIGQRPEIGTKQKTLDGFGRYKNDQLLAVFDAVDGDTIRNASYDDTEILQQIADVLNQQFMKQLPSEESVFKMFRKKPLYTADKINIAAIQDAYNAWEDAGRTIPTEADYYSIESELRSNKALEEDASYQRWVEDIFDGIIKDSGIPNGRDYYDSYGNRRSFKALHVPATLENIVKQMRKENETGVGALGSVNLRGAATKTYATVEDMRKDSGKLLGTHIDDEVYDGYMDGFHARLSDLKQRAAKGDDWSTRDTAEQILLESIRDAKTKAKMNTLLRKEAQWINYDQSLVDELWQLKMDVQNMPAPYFEAKPRRIVSPHEAAAYIIPDDAPARLIEELQKRGLQYKTYKAGDEADRLNKLNELLEEQPDLKFSLSNVGEEAPVYGNYNVYGKDIALETAPEQEVAPIADNATSNAENVLPNATVSETESVGDLFPDEPDPAQVELDMLQQQKDMLESRMLEAVNEGSFDTFNEVNTEYEAVMARIGELENTLSAADSERLATLGDADAPPEMEAPYQGESENAPVENPFEERDWYKVGNPKVKAYMYENPEVKPFFQDEALALMSEWNDTTRGAKYYSEEAFKRGGNEEAWTGVKRHTSKSMEILLDGWDMSYDDIQKGLNAIIEDNGAENIAAAKKIEFMLNDRLLNGYTDFYTNQPVPPNQDYINLLEEKQINEYSDEAFKRFMENADLYAPATEEDIAPIKPAPVFEEVKNAPKQVEGQQAMWTDADKAYEAVTPKPKRKTEPKMVRADTPFDQKTAEVLVEEPKTEQKKSKLWSMVKENVLDNGMVFEDLSLKTKNRELQAKWNSIRYAQSKAQWLMGNGTGGVKSLNAIREQVEKTGKTKEFYEYLYHKHNVDRMQLEDRYEDTPNKPVFGYSVTADVSQDIVNQYEKSNPAFKRYARDVYSYMNHLRGLLVDNGVISQEIADLWAEMYPHYVPIRRADDTGLNINVPLDTGKTGVNAPVKRATGGNSNILPLFDTMGQRTMQTFRAIAKNSFGVELKNTLGSTVENKTANLDEVIDSLDAQDSLLQEGKNGRNPTFTVFEDGERVTFEITDEMYDALKPTSRNMAYTNKVLNTASNLHRGLLTEYNPVFMMTNAIKDTQDILINSQHPAKTYANLPKATMELSKNGKWYQEYMENGGDQNTYFDGESNTFTTEEKGLKKLLGIPPISWISKANNFIEKAPRLAEYIASREAGRSIEVSMLDAARVTTNFAAGGKLAKLFNRNGATFLNASIQGVVQQARNFREAKMNGLKGWTQLAGKFTVAGLPAILLNNLLWDDDEDYEELSDYVKQNYYVVAKYGDGKFVRIPKGRTVAVIQNAVEQVSNALTGDDEADLWAFLEIAVSNLAPNNPIEDNILAPIAQVASNKTWYGEDLVPTRLQDLPAAEQYDESTDAISRWLGEKLNYSPVKINYLLDQYSGGIGDTFLPMLTPEAESGDDSFLGNMIAPLKSKFTTDAVMNNQNVSDFYDTKDELTTNAKSSMATDEDVLMNKYMNSINAELADLYSMKRQIQSGSLSNSKKYEMVRNIQKQIDALAEESLITYKNVSINGEYATVGDRYFKLNDEGEWQKMSDEQVTKYKATSAAGDALYATDGENHYRYYQKDGETEGEWRKLTDEQLEKQNEVVNGLDITPEDYWSNKEEYDYAYEHPENYAVAKAVGGYASYRSYSSELYDIKADKDENGKSISGSRKEKVAAYIDTLDADSGAKMILFKSEYPADDTYNEAIVKYLDGREDISWEEMKTILTKLDFIVYEDGTIMW